MKTHCFFIVVSVCLSVFFPTFLFGLNFDFFLFGDLVVSCHVGLVSFVASFVPFDSRFIKRAYLCVRGMFLSEICAWQRSD